MIDSPRNPGKAGEPPNTRAVPSPGRRRLLQAGISAAPVIMTVASRPVLAAGNCQSPSGFVSGNASNQGTTVCTGRTPAYWAGQSTWPTGDPNLDPNVTKVQDVFRGSSDVSLLKAVLGGGSADVKAQIVAAYLNIRYSSLLIPPTVLTLTQVQHMWTEFAANQGYTPSTGAHWNAGELLDYLQRIQPNP